MLAKLIQGAEKIPFADAFRRSFREAYAALGDKDAHRVSSFRVDGAPNKWRQRWLRHPSYDEYWQDMGPYKDEFARIPPRIKWWTDSCVRISIWK